MFLLWTENVRRFGELLFYACFGQFGRKEIILDNLQGNKSFFSERNHRALKNEQLVRVQCYGLAFTQKKVQYL